MDDNEITIEREKGSGRVVILLYSAAKYGPLVEDCFRGIKEEQRTIILNIPAVHEGNWRSLASSFERICAENSWRSFHAIAFGDACVAATQLGVAKAKDLRSLVLVDGFAQAEKSWAQLKRLFFGSKPCFDVRCFLHRIRCPVLVVLTDLAGTWEERQREILMSRLPTAFYLRAATSVALVKAIQHFFLIPPKCPQNRR